MNFGKKSRNTNEYGVKHLCAEHKILLGGKYNEQS